jgi:TetR/AcrR family transcriptional regulator, transcriptional repressor for nem operon
MGGWQFSLQKNQSCKKSILGSATEIAPSLLSLIYSKRPIGLAPQPMSKAAETKARIIEQAALLFNQQGYAGSSMSDLMRVTQLEKGGIYNHFKSKDEIALAAFDFANQHIQQQFAGALKGKRRAPERLLAMLTVYRNLQSDPILAGGCPLLNTAVESDDAHPQLRQRTQAAMDRWRQMIRRILVYGQQRGEVMANLDIEQSITVLIATIEGAIMLSKLYGEPHYLEAALNYLEDYIQHQIRHQSTQVT